MSLGDGAKQPLSQYEQLPKSRVIQVLVAVAIGTFMAPLDASVVNLALPKITSGFHTTLAVVEWVVMAYLLMISSLLLTFGRLGDMYGHKRIYISGFVLFTIGSVFCGLSPGISVLIASRVIQAVGAGMLMSMGPAIITDISPPQERGRYLGVIAVSVSIALTAGPIIGGFLVDKFGWPSIFFINIPVGIIATILGQRVIPKTGGHEVQSFDIKGAVTFFVALMSILLPLSYTEKYGWSNPYLLSLLAFGIIVLVLFVVMEKTTRYPMIDMALFNNRLFSMANLSALLSYIALFSAILIMPFYLQQLRGMDPAQAGLFVIPMPLTTLLVAPVSGAVSDRVDSRYISSLGMAFVGIGFWLLSHLEIDSSHLAIIISMVFVGFGSGLFQTPNNSAVMGSVPPQRRGIASGLLATMRNVGMVLGVAISGAVFTSHLSYLTTYLASQGLSGTEVKVQAFTGAMHLTFNVAATVAAVGVVTSLIRGPITKNNGNLPK